jgi:hypothetical protein
LPDAIAIDVAKVVRSFLQTRSRQAYHLNVGLAFGEKKAVIGSEVGVVFAFFPGRFGVDKALRLGDFADVVVVVVTFVVLEVSPWVIVLVVTTFVVLVGVIFVVVVLVMVLAWDFGVFAGLGLPGFFFAGGMSVVDEGLSGVAIKSAKRVSSLLTGVPAFFAEFGLDGVVDMGVALLTSAESFSGVPVPLEAFKVDLAVVAAAAFLFPLEVPTFVFPGLELAFFFFGEVLMNPFLVEVDALTAGIFGRALSGVPVFLTGVVVAAVAWGAWKLAAADGATANGVVAASSNGRDTATCW